MSNETDRLYPDPGWDRPPPPWAPRRTRAWYLMRSHVEGAVTAAAERVAAALPAKRRGR